MNTDFVKAPIVVGSMNPAKIAAVKKAIVALSPQHPPFEALTAREVIGFGARSRVREQPTGLDEIVHGARCRALHALEEHPDAITFGIESGVFLQRIRPTELPARERLFDLCACVIAARGMDELLGFSSAWALPEDVSEHIVRGHGRVTMDEAMVRTGRTKDPKLGYNVEEGGVLGVLAKGMIDRTRYTAQAVTAALVDWDSTFSP